MFEWLDYAFMIRALALPLVMALFHSFIFSPRQSAEPMLGRL